MLIDSVLFQIVVDLAIVQFWKIFTLDGTMNRNIAIILPV